jgi:hypothetical protein
MIPYYLQITEYMTLLQGQLYSINIAVHVQDHDRMHIVHLNM